MPKKTAPPKDREAVMIQARALLAEHFDVSLCIVSWEDEGQTFYMDFKFGNDYAARALCSNGVREVAIFRPLGNSGQQRCK